MNFLNDIIPARYRQAVYALVSLLALVWGVYEVSDGDWKKFIGGLIVALTTATAASNPSPDPSPPHLPEDADKATSGVSEYTPEPPYVEPEPSLIHGDGADRGAEPLTEEYIRENHPEVAADIDKAVSGNDLPGPSNPPRDPRDRPVG